MPRVTSPICLRSRRISWVVLSLLLFVVGDSTRADDATIDFERDVRPILSEHCFQCHGPDEGAREADLRLDTEEGLLGSGIIEPGQPDASTIMERVTSNDGDERMPPPDAKLDLSDQAIDVLRRWIAEGATWKGHWSLQTVKRPELPAVQQVQWPRNPIDFFVLHQMEQRRLRPSPEEGRARLLRRVTLDLTGIPPTVDEVDAFLADRSADAYERVVDRLLASPRYGERMAWDWLDAARYADSNGFQGDRERTMWPWRDWVIGSLNDNLPYDEFSVWQIAGDRLPQATHEQRLATGFCRNHMINGEGGRIAEENRVEYIFDQVETVGTIWLGLTLQCCRCHDHKFDPLTRQNYYELFDFFNRTAVNGGGGDPQTPPNMAVPSLEQRQQLEQAQQAIQTHADQWNTVTLTTSVSQTEAPPRPVPEPIRKILQKDVAKRTDKELEQLEKHFAGQQPLVQSIKRLRQLRNNKRNIEKSFPRVMIMQDVAKPRTTFMLEKGLYNQPGAKVSAALPQAIGIAAQDDALDRLELARWLVATDHPLVARVTVNRHWQMLLGRGLVKTANDFGVQGTRPSHPQLLDWLAIELVQTGWDVKQLHRSIVTSATYRQTARVDAERLELDPENQWLSRGPRYRLPSWMLRDQALAVSGLLVEEIGGRPVKPYQPAGVWQEATFGKKKYAQDHGRNLYRRSLYTFWRRIIGPTMFFDVGKRQTCSVSVTRTASPLHALVTLNDTTYVEAARVMAARVMDAHGETRQRLNYAFKLVTSREPSAREREIMRSRLKVLHDKYAAQAESARQLIAVGESPVADRHDAADLAAYTGLCLMLLNLDETLTN